METLIFLVVIGTSIWVGYDSSTNKITSGNGPYTLMNGALGWVIVCLLLWIVAFPAYLVRRSKLMGEREKKMPAPVYSVPAPGATPNLSAELEKLAALKAAGHLSEGDYERAKTKVLG